MQLCITKLFTMLIFKNSEDSSNLQFPARVPNLTSKMLSQNLWLKSQVGLDKQKGDAQTQLIPLKSEIMKVPKKF